ncbi:hypothetical protein G9A89_015472 [Geosiphon pyriformis]|nr:hypothetical protein G9A89_015472 [Geosiphon pyriformis]
MNYKNKPIASQANSNKYKSRRGKDKVCECQQFNRTLCESLAKVSTNFEQEWDFFIPSVTATLPISFTVETYPAQPINENNFQETLQQRAYTLLSTLEEKRRIAATHIEYS